MKHAMNEYLALVEHGQPAPDVANAAGVRAALIALRDRTLSEDGLATEAAWRLAPVEARRLEDACGYRPPGGWSALAALACGCDVLQARRDQFVVSPNAPEIFAWDETTARRQLLQAFTRRLVPPSAAAGLFILVGLHPAWGLHLAHRLHLDHHGEGPAPGEPGWRDESLFPEPIFEVTRRALFGVVAAVLATLRRLDATRSYSVDALGSLVLAACRHARDEIRSGAKRADAGGLPVLLDAAGGVADTAYRARDFATSDLLDAVLVPSGVARRFDDASFWVAVDVLDAALVDGWDADDQDMQLSWLLAGTCQVA